MVVLSQPVLDNNLAHITTCKPTSYDDFTGIPVVDLSDPSAKTQITNACREFGFFKVVNHCVPMEFLAQMEAEAVKFFKSSQQEKEISGPPSPFGYGSKNIGPNGDVGWVEYLLFSTNPELAASHSIIPGISETLWGLVNEYVSAVRNMTCEVVEMIGEELGSDKLSKMISDEKSDSCFRINYYPAAYPEQLRALSAGRSLIGFGEHTDPQIISVMRSNDTSGLQICLTDGTWVSVPPDHTSFFFIVGDSLQVISNGRYRSVKHRVYLGDSLKSRVSMIYFGGPPLDEKIGPIVIEEGEDCLYKEFTGSEYKKSAYKTRLGDNRLAFFQIQQ